MDKYRDTEIVSAEVREITPSMASEMLGKNEGNRNVSQAKVQYYARLMREGSWKLTHQGIAISQDGNVIDGQHRLSSVAMYGKPVSFLVTTMKAKDDQGTLTAIGQPIDIGKLRTISDITDEPVDHVRIVRTLIRDFVPGGSDRSQDPEIVAAGIDIMRDSLVALNERCGATRKGMSLATVRAIMAIRHISGIDVLDDYKNALNRRYEALTKSWVSWASRLESMSDGATRIPKNHDFRRFVAAITWQVTDPSKGLDQSVMIKNTERYHEIISGEVQGILMSTLTKNRLK